VDTDARRPAKNAQVADVLAEIQALMASVRANVGQLNAILTPPEAPSGNTTAPA